MDLICANDTFKVELGSILTDFDRKVLSELYQPIIGYTSLSLFFTLWSKHERKIALDFVPHQYIFSTMKINQRDFSSAKRKLEGLGLLRTFVENSDDNTKKYIYVLYSPKSPKDFFDDVLFSGLLTKAIGNEEANLIAKSFVSTQKKDEKFKEVTTSFVDEYKPNFEDQCFNNNLGTLDSYSRKIRAINTEFDFASFFSQIKSDYILEERMFSRNELLEIERVSTLYGIDELTMSSLVNDNFDRSKKLGSRLDKEKFVEACEKENRYYIKPQCNTSKEYNLDDLDAEISLMLTLSTQDYLVYLQNGAKASSADLNIANSLSKEYGLNVDVINCVIYYSIKKCDNKLIKTYVEKVAASIVRSNITNALDAYQYLFNEKDKVNAETTIIKTSSKKKTKVTESKEIDNADNNDSEVDEVLASRLNPALWR